MCSSFSYYIDINPLLIKKINRFTSLPILQIDLLKVGTVTIRVEYLVQAILLFFIDGFIEF